MNAAAIVEPTKSGIALLECERVIEAGKLTFIEVGSALCKIRDERLYLERGYGSFNEYCEERWDWGKSYVSRIITAADIAQKLPIGNSITTESQARELAKVPEAKREEVIKKASEGGKLTAKSIAKAAETPQEETAPASEASNQPEEPTAHEVLAALKIEPAVTEYYAKLESVMLDAIANATDKQLASMSVYAALLPKLIKDELRRRGVK